MKIRKLQININLAGHKAGSVVNVTCDDKGIPLDVFWRRRLKDAKIDNCVEWTKESPKSTVKKERGDKS